MVEKSVSPDCTGRVFIDSRNSISISGVTDIISFDEMSAILKTTLGIMAIEGEELHVEKLDVNTSDAVIGGRINGVMWNDGNGKSKRSKKVFG